MRNCFHVLTAGVLLATLAPSAYADDGKEPICQRTPMPEKWGYEGIVSDIIPDDTEWWQSFDDPVLDSLVSVGIERNLNLAQASRRIEAAHLAVLGAKSSYFPQIDIGAGYTRSRSRATEADQFSIGAKMSWEIDVFGKISSQVRSKRSDLQMSRAEYRGAMISLIADIATYYINYCLVQRQLEVAREHMESEDKVLKITEARHEAGLVSKLDVAQAKTVYGNTMVTVPRLEASLTQTLGALAILLGEYPGQLSIPDGQNATLPSFNHIIPAGIPADLLRRRPDIAEAEATLAGYAAQIGIAKKDFLPTLSLDGTVGFSSEKAGKLFNGNSFTYSVGPTLSWTLFDGLGRKYALAQAREQMEAGIDNYNLTVMTAVEEVSNCLSTYSAAIRTVELESIVLADSKEAFSLSIDQYTQGLSPFTNVVNAQIDWLNCANSLAVAQGNALLALVNLYKALGGTPDK